MYCSRHFIRRARVFKNNTALYIILLIFFKANAQPDTAQIAHVNKTNESYLSFVTCENKAFVTTKNGKIVVWDLTLQDTIHFAPHDTSDWFTCLALDRQNQVYAGTSRGEVYRINTSSLTPTLVLNSKYFVFAICFNSNNKMLLAVKYAIYDPYKRKSWSGFTSHASGLIYSRQKFFSAPQFDFHDSKDRWWLCASHGEFGGDVQIFDTKNEKIYDKKIESIVFPNLTPKSVFEDTSGNVYITSGLQHFMNFGEIYRIGNDDVAKKIFDSDVYAKEEKESDSVGGLFIGPGVYNKFDGNIYLYTSNGIYRAMMFSDGSIKKLEPILNPSLHWSREPLAIGVGMAVHQMAVTSDNKLIFLTENDGLGIYDWKRLTLLR
ncbi:hypothetical protein Q4E93_21975 [Flavitalea sp. BT771]|uniref:hypothetical protein n=1 Tax=Flavitalea sp. BT771 TaxID=3063329 RepID=UPI0026E26740|nr:hypothetical protein [Flavitalea sp. BT771]MDO6433295.1 hypothetical protein [Flavitalea sp. BT771]MDV6222800.1 hypothetical protein [Flavitalea sp. BT771]